MHNMVIPLAYSISLMYIYFKIVYLYSIKIAQRVTLIVPVDTFEFYWDKKIILFLLLSLTKASIMFFLYKILSKSWQSFMITKPDWLNSLYVMWVLHIYISVCARKSMKNTTRCLTYQSSHRSQHKTRITCCHVSQFGIL